MKIVSALRVLGGTARAVLRFMEWAAGIADTLIQIVLVLVGCIVFWVLWTGARVDGSSTVLIYVFGGIFWLLAVSEAMLWLDLLSKLFGGRGGNVQNDAQGNARFASGGDLKENR